MTWRNEQEERQARARELRRLFEHARKVRAAAAKLPRPSDALEQKMAELRRLYARDDEKGELIELLEKMGVRSDIPPGSSQSDSEDDRR